MGPLKIDLDLLLASLRTSAPTLPDGHDFHIPMWKLARIFETSIYNLAWQLKIANTPVNELSNDAEQAYKQGIQRGIERGRAAASSDVTMDFLGILYSIKISGNLQADWPKIKELLDVLVSKAGTGIEDVPKLDWGQPEAEKKPENTAEFKAKEAK